MRLARLNLAIIFGLVCLHTYTGAQTSHSQLTWPTVFAPEVNKGFEHAHPPSGAVLDALMKSPEVANTEFEDAKPDRETVRKWFHVVRVNLGDANEEDYVILGGGAYTGADSHWFWIVRVKEGKGQVLLYTPGLEIKILRQITNGYYDIRESWGGNSGSVTRIFRYSGAKYRFATEHSEGPQK
jgi:hypothetical protein